VSCGLLEGQYSLISGVHQTEQGQSAKGGARSSPHYGGEGVLIHPPHQGVCGRHGTEDLCVTPGELVWSSGGAGERDPISREAKWESMLCEQSDRCMVPEAR